MSRKIFQVLVDVKKILIANHTRKSFVEFAVTGFFWFWLNTLQKSSDIDIEFREDDRLFSECQWSSLSFVLTVSTFRSRIRKLMRLSLTEFANFAQNTRNTR